MVVVCHNRCAAPGSSPMFTPRPSLISGGDHKWPLQVLILLACRIWGRRAARDLGSRHWGRKVRRAKLVHRGQQGLRANAAKLDRTARQVRPVRQDHRVPRAIQVQHLRSASLRAQTTRNAQTMTSWFH